MAAAAADKSRNGKWLRLLQLGQVSVLDKLRLQLGQVFVLDKLRLQLGQVSVGQAPSSTRASLQPGLFSNLASTWIEPYRSTREIHNLDDL